MSAVDRVLVPDKWPTHVSVKKYYQPKGARVMGKSDGEPPVYYKKRLTR